MDRLKPRLAAMVTSVDALPWMVIVMSSRTLFVNSIGRSSFRSTHQKLLSQLLSKVYDGGMIARGEGRMVCRLVGEVGDLARELGKNLQSKHVQPSISVS